MNFNEKLRQSRLAVELSQEAAAEKAGVSRQTMSNWENGKSYPDIASVITLSDVYGVTIDSLVKGDTAMIKHLEESTNVRKSNRQVAASLIGLGLLLIGGVVLVLIIGASIVDFIDLPSWMMIVVPLLAVLTVTRSFKVFWRGFRSALFPKTEITEELRDQAVSLFRLMSLTAVLASVFCMLFALVSIGFNLDSSYFAENPGELIAILPRNLAAAIFPWLYSLPMVFGVFEPIRYILRTKRV